ncbi:MAG: amidohydrolase family protein [Saprospiraceae bacterium]|nr:amidohydrolase family protein [Saprospiraceae bacterium]
MRKITCDRLYPVAQPPIENGVVVVADDGLILQVGTAIDFDRSELEYHRGVIVPGFVNAHCHLELSHMKGKVPTGTGLIPFITSVVQQRSATSEMIAEAIRNADAEMYQNGIVAVGDISNTADTFARKAASPIRYYTFVEMFDFLQDDQAEHCFEQYHAVFEQLTLPPGHRKTCVPHAPYTVSPSLFAKIRTFNTGPQQTVSIHNQEMEAENALFRNKTGALIPFYEGFDLSLAHFSPIGAGSIHYALMHLDPDQRTLFVHNTLTTEEEARAAHAWSEHVYWATCPNANLYIENRLPDYAALGAAGARITIGTDSLTSNWQLSVLEEMKTIMRYQSFIPFDEILQWATLNGAHALGFAETLGSIEAGKRPGLNLLEMDAADPVLTNGTSVVRLV